MPNSVSGCDGIAVFPSCVARCFVHSACVGAAKSPGRRLENAWLGPIWCHAWERVDDVASMCPGGLSGRARPGVERLHQVRADLGWLAPWAEIMQIGSAL